MLAELCQRIRFLMWSGFSGLPACLRCCCTQSVGRSNHEVFSSPESLGQQYCEESFVQNQGRSCSQNCVSETGFSTGCTNCLLDLGDCGRSRYLYATMESSINTCFVSPWLKRKNEKAWSRAFLAWRSARSSRPWRGTHRESRWSRCGKNFAPRYRRLNSSPSLQKH